jgi:hypothetical protein
MNCDLATAALGPTESDHSITIKQIPLHRGMCSLLDCQAGDIIVLCTAAIFKHKMSVMAVSLLRVCLTVVHRNQFLSESLATPNQSFQSCLGISVVNSFTCSRHRIELLTPVYVMKIPLFEDAASYHMHVMRRTSWRIPCHFAGSVRIHF